ncbi:ABC transporter ATP-binding protein/permease [Lachnospiraceae bacterium OttesenSCG-928-D06]|nr:ABC transporter ATP-binding protein/permease [Lachnospiraceae bacterium OttesenSCG-928-D06]
MNTIKKLQRMYKSSGQSKQFFMQGVFIITLGILSAVSSIFLGFLAQSVIEVTAESLYFCFTIFLLSSLVAALLDWISKRSLVVMVEKSKASYRSITTKALLKADYDHIQGMETGDLITRVNTDAESAGRGCELMITAVRNITIPLILFVVILIMDWRLAISFILPFAGIFLYQIFSSMGYVGIGPWREAFAAMASETQDILSNRITIKAFGLQKKAEQWTEEKIEDYRHKGVKGLGIMYMTTIPGLFMNTLPLIACSVVGAMLVYTGELSIQGFVAVFMLAQIAIGELLNLPNIFVNMPTSLVSAERLFEIWDIKEEISGEEKCEKEIEEIISVDHLYFRYDKEEDFILQDISFSIKEGEKVALVGSSGCGKSTILKILAGLYLPEKGMVRLWGNELSEWNMEALRLRLAYMQQETFLFEGTIRENIICALPEAEEDLLVNAAKKANLLEFILEQKEGWDTTVGENGSFLSGGLRQRVGLARIFLQNAKLLLLDEATSALDAKNEEDMLAALNTIGKGRTQISVAHRLAAIMDADRILVLDKGKIVEEGRHEDLLKNNGLYAALYKEQEEREGNDSF